MSEGYPQGQAPNPYAQPQNAYQQPPNPYGPPHTPYGQQPPAYQQPQQAPNAYQQPPAYQQPQQVQYQQPQAWSQQPQPPSGQAQTPYPSQQPGLNLPEEAGAFRQIFGIFVDFMAVVAVGFFAATGVPNLWFLMMFAAPLLFSFINQVVLIRLVGCTVGKFLMATRVISTKTGGRPTMWDLSVRWVVRMTVSLIETLLDSRSTTGELNEPRDFWDMRTVRWKHLRERLG